MFVEEGCREPGVCPDIGFGMGFDDCVDIMGMIILWMYAWQYAHTSARASARIGTCACTECENRLLVTYWVLLQAAPSLSEQELNNLISNRLWPKLRSVASGLTVHRQPTPTGLQSIVVYLQATHRLRPEGHLRGRATHGVDALA